jgi:hypothetical protein
MGPIGSAVVVDRRRPALQHSGSLAVVRDHLVVHEPVISRLTVARSCGSDHDPVSMVFSQRARDLELLAIQAEPSFDRRGRVADCYGITIACCKGGQALWIGADVPDAMASELEAVFERSSPPTDPTEPPPALELCEKIVGAVDDALERTAGPHYLVPDDLRFDSPIAIARSDGSSVDRLRNANPGNWHPVEWDELLDGQLGPWAIATEDDLAISICHTPGPLTEHAGECGVWTDPRFRGRGYAAATAAAWVALARSPQRHLFYATDANNLSSQRVARRLNLPELGWTWRLHRARADHGLRLHPLCSLYNSQST